MNILRMLGEFLYVALDGSSEGVFSMRLGLPDETPGKGLLLPKELKYSQDGEF
jgi:hypothetical protein